MRVTADKDDPDYREEYIGAKVYLNGALQGAVISADDVAGTVESYVLNEKGIIVCDRSDQRAPMTNIQHGQVVIELPKPRIFKRGQL